MSAYEGEGESEQQWETELLDLVDKGELAVGRGLMTALNPSS